MSDDLIRRIPIKEIVSEEGAHELATSPDTQPYIRLITAELKGIDTQPYLDEIAGLPLEKRYVWRVASALKWGFADCDDVHVDADRQTLSPGDLAKVTDLLQYRPLQFCIFLKALVGEEKMQQMMIQAIAQAKESA